MSKKNSIIDNINNVSDNFIMIISTLSAIFLIPISKWYCFSLLLSILSILFSYIGGIILSEFMSDDKGKITIGGYKFNQYILKPVIHILNISNMVFIFWFLLYFVLK
jgi:hypothetical protein